MDGIYIHIPFCIKKCDYCDFVSFPENGMADSYFSALHREIELWSGRCAGREFDTVFFGGGTPSALPSEYITDTMAKLRQCFNMNTIEATIECNPGTVDAEKLEAYRRAGFTRLSIGVQSFDGELLRSIGRIHTPDQAEKCVRLAQKAGFDNVNIDLMYGLPGQTRLQYLSSIDRAASMGIQHVSAYSLILEENTPLYLKVRKGETRLPDDNTVYEMHREGINRLKSLGFYRYEISNYCRSGRECLHNLNCWNVGEYLGVGLSASSGMRLDGVMNRWSNTASITKYMDLLGHSELPAADRQVVGREEEMFEWAMLGLRKISGVDRRNFMLRFGVDFTHIYSAAVDKLTKMGWLKMNKNSIFLTDEGLDMQNSALMEFME